MSTEQLNDSVGTEKQGHVCCGNCCDTRKAVITLSVFSILFNVAVIAFINYGTDILAVIVPSVSIVFALVGLIGARNYNSTMVLWALVYLVVFMIFGIVTMVAFRDDFIDELEDEIDDDAVNPENVLYFQLGQYICFNLLYIYPHVFLVKELNSGIMSKETADREDYCWGTSARSSGSPARHQVGTHARLQNNVPERVEIEKEETFIKAVTKFDGTTQDDFEMEA